MADSKFGLKIGLEGEKEFKRSLSEINQSFKVLGSEMKLVDSQFDKNDTSTEALTERNRVLGKQIDAQKQKIEVLRSALQNAASSFGENDRRTQAWQIQLNNAQAALNGMERELRQNEAALDGTADGMSEAAKGTDRLGDELKSTGKESDETGGKLENLGKVCTAVGVAVTAACAAIAAAAVSAGKALIQMSVDGAAFADGVLTESTVTGIATDKLQEYMYAAELVDVSTETLTKSMAKQIKSMKAVQDGTKLSVEAYEKLGVTVLDADGNLRDSDTVYWEVIDALGKLENETERDALGMQILGKSAQELNPLITAGAARMAELGRQAQAAGYVISEDMLNAYNISTVKRNMEHIVVLYIFCRFSDSCLKQDISTISLFHIKRQKIAFVNDRFNRLYSRHKIGLIIKTNCLVNMISDCSNLAYMHIIIFFNPINVIVQLFFKALLIFRIFFDPK